MANEDPKAEFAVSLQGDDLIATAESAAQALEKLKGSIDSDVQALAGMQRAMKNIQGGGKQFDDQVRRLKNDIDAQKKSIATSQSSYVQLGGSFAKSGASGRSFSERVKQVTGKTDEMKTELTKGVAASSALDVELGALAKSAGLLPGPLGAIVSRLGSTGGLLKAAASSTFVFIAAIVGLVAALGIAISKLYEYGKAQAEARRSEFAHIEALTKMRFLFNSVHGNAKEMQGAIDRVSGSALVGRDKLVQYNEQLYRMGLRGENLATALDAFQMKAALQGEAAANVFAGWAAGAALTGGSVKRLADRVRSDLGGIAQRQLESTEVQSQKLHESFNRLFSDLKMDDYLHQWRLVNDLLSQSTASGRALKQIMEVVLQPLIDASAAGAPILKRFFQGMIIEAQRLTILYLSLRLAWKRFVGPIPGDWNPGVNAMVTGRVVVLTLATAFAFLAGNVIAATWPFLLAAAAIYGVFNTARLLYELWDEIDWSGMGSAIWQGIVSGLKAGASAIVTVAEGIADDVTNAFKSALGIHSPSQVFADLGMQIPRGVAVGIDRGQPVAEAAMERAAAPRIPMTPDSSSSPGAAAAAAGAMGRASGPTITIGDIVINTDSKEAESLARDVKREIERVLEGIALQIGAPVAGGT